MSRNQLLSLGVVAAALTWVTPQSQANGGHFMIDDAAILPPASCELETWITRQRPDTQLTFNPACNFTGASEWSLPIEYDTRSSETTGIGLEYKSVLFSGNSGPLIALVGGGHYQRSSNELSELYLYLPFSFRLLDNLALHLNGGVLHDRIQDDTYATWGVAATVKTVSGPVLIMEVADDDRHDPTYGGGARFNIGSTRWTLDLGVARDTHHEETAYTMGVNIPVF